MHFLNNHNSSKFPFVNWTVWPLPNVLGFLFFPVLLLESSVSLLFFGLFLEPICSTGDHSALLNVPVAALRQEKQNDVDLEKAKEQSLCLGQGKAGEGLGAGPRTMSGSTGVRWWGKVKSRQPTLRKHGVSSASPQHL
jgi:hypothetical protein